jgi:hypothetical protein
MSETKDQIADERDRLREENQRLRAQLAEASATTAGGAYRPAQQFVLSEGDRQELEMRGTVNVGGRMRTADEVRDMMGERGADVPIGEPSEALDRRGDVQGQRVNAGIPGVDFVYPSVAPGVIDPSVAGTPGINGPSADRERGLAPAGGVDHEDQGAADHGDRA